MKLSSFWIVPVTGLLIACGSPRSVEYFAEHDAERLEALSDPGCKSQVASAGVAGNRKSISDDECANAYDAEVKARQARAAAAFEEAVKRRKDNWGH